MKNFKHLTTAYEMLSWGLFLVEFNYGQRENQHITWNSKPRCYVSWLQISKWQNAEEIWNLQLK